MRHSMTQLRAIQADLRKSGRLSARALTTLRAIERAGGTLTFWHLEVHLGWPEGCARRGLLTFTPPQDTPDGNVRWTLTQRGRAALETVKQP